MSAGAPRLSAAPSVLKGGGSLFTSSAALLSLDVSPTAAAGFFFRLRKVSAGRAVEGSRLNLSTTTVAGYTPLLPARYLEFSMLFAGDKCLWDRDLLTSRLPFCLLALARESAFTSPMHSARNVTQFHRRREHSRPVSPFHPPSRKPRLFRKIALPSRSPRHSLLST